MLCPFLVGFWYFFVLFPHIINCEVQWLAWDDAKKSRGKTEAGNEVPDCKYDIHRHQWLKASDHNSVSKSVLSIALSLSLYIYIYICILSMLGLLFFFLLYLFIHGCTESLVLHSSFPLLQWGGPLCSCGVRASHCAGSSCCGALAQGHSGFSSCVTQA